MSGMRTVVVDKIASVTQACGLSHEIRIAADIPCEEGLVVVVEILNNKSTYNTLELTSGRMAKVARGDVVVGALGHRKALFGYSGHIPPALKPGDVVQMLNIGGVLGICDSATPDKGKPFDCKVLGAVLTFPYLGERIGVPRSTRAACRWWRLPARAWRRARRPRPPPSSRACAIGDSRWMPSRRRECRCGVTFWRSRTPARGAP
jgi:hypothetical protein